MLLREDAAFKIECQELKFFCPKTVQIRVILFHQPIRSVVELHNAKRVYSGERASKADHFVRVPSKEQQDNFFQFQNPHLHKLDPNRLYAPYEKQDPELLSSNLNKKPLNIPKNEPKLQDSLLFVSVSFVRTYQLNQHDHLRGFLQHI